MINYLLISYIFILLSFMIRFQLLISNINYDFENLNSIINNKFNICKKKIKDFILKTNNDKYIIKNNINEIEDIINENYEDLIILKLLEIILLLLLNIIIIPYYFHPILLMILLILMIFIKFIMINHLILLNLIIKILFIKMIILIIIILIFYIKLIKIMI